jgi:predicted DCC family thiol-disulfide oxidoreductase YuxK
MLNVRGRLEQLFDIGDRLLVIFDGHCGFCNGSVRWLIRRDQQDRLRFAALDSEKVEGVLARHSLSGLELPTGTLVVVVDAGGAAENVLLRSDAVAALLRELPWPWRWVGVGLKWIPRPLRDLGYRLVARWRHRISGRLESCPLSSPEDRARFL